jgi:hypothetical protein
MLKQSQKRTKRAAFIEELLSKTPAKYAGWFATIPIVFQPGYFPVDSPLPSNLNIAYACEPSSTLCP